MTFNYTPADRPAIWMEFVPAGGEKFAPERMVHLDMTGETRGVNAEEKQADEEVPTVAEDSSENTAGPHILPVDRASQLTECEYHQDCIPVGKRRAVQLPADSLNLTTTTGRGRDAAVVEMRMSADQVGSPADCIVLKCNANSLPKKFSVMAEGSKNDRLRCPKIDRMFCPQVAADKALTAQKMCREIRLKSSLDAPVSRPGCWHQIDEDAVALRFVRHVIHGLVHVSHGERRNASWHRYRSIYRPSFDSSRGHLRHVRSGSIDSFSVNGILIRN